jgi:hypothetical protein
MGFGFPFDPAIRLLPLQRGTTPRPPTSGSTLARCSSLIAFAKNANKLEALLFGLSAQAAYGGISSRFSSFRFAAIDGEKP